MPLNTTQYARATDNVARCFCDPVAPTANQDAGYPQSNILLPDRYTVWKCSAPVVDENGDLTVRVNRSLPFTMGAVGLLNYCPLDGVGGVVHFYCRAGTDMEDYPWNDMGTLNMAEVNTEYGYSVTRYKSDNSKTLLQSFSSIKQFKMVFVGCAGLSLGGIYMGPALSDLGVVYAPGSTEATVGQRSRVRLLDGREVVTEYGGSRRVLVMNFPNSSSTRRDLLRRLATDLLPFVLKAPSGETFECRAIADTFTSEAVWGIAGNTTSDLWNCTLEVESLP
jgi:hypothetical protein